LSTTYQFQTNWHQAGGPETEDNGLALGVLHHATFDIGAFAVSDAVLLVSDQANVTSALSERRARWWTRPRAR
jgi:putative restriction endonuclease